MPRDLSRILRMLTVAIVAFAGLTIAGPANASEPAPSERTARYEVRFMTGMIDHHAMAVMMGEMCQERAVHGELLDTCQEIVTSQTEEIQTMQGWLADWYAISHSPEMDMGSMDRLHRLAGEDFEIAFMRMMIRHHWQAVRESEQCLDRAFHPELRNLCQDIITAQLAEIEQMQTWLEAWYDRHGGRPAHTGSGLLAGQQAAA
jgi:uncharacterized protein (DUF305 family)